MSSLGAVELCILKLLVSRSVEMFACETQASLGLFVFALCLEEVAKPAVGRPEIGVEFDCLAQQGDREPVVTLPLGHSGAIVPSSRESRVEAQPAFKAFDGFVKAACLEEHGSEFVPQHRIIAGCTESGLERPDRFVGPLDLTQPA